jgi:hypothetical protein
VQNTVDYRDLGVATSGVTFFRTLGSAFGAAIFGTVYANVLNNVLPAAVARSPGVDPAAVASPKTLHAYPAERIAPIVDAYAHALHVVFLFAVPVAGVAFVLALFLKEVPLRDTAKAGAGDVGGGFGMPERAESLEQLELAIARLLRSGGPSAMAEIREESGTRLDVGDGWCVGAVYLRARLGRDADVTEIAHRYRLPGAVLRPAFEHARAAGYLTGDDDQLRLTETGQQEIDGLIAAMFAWLSRELRDWDIEDDQLLRDAMGNIARQIVEQDPFPAPTPELTAAAAR